MTKTAFLEALRNELLSRYPWAQDAAKLAKFMDSARATIHGETRSWNKDGEASESAWKAIGGKGKPTYKALEQLA